MKPALYLIFILALLIAGAALGQAATPCMNLTQVQAERTRCLYTYSNVVYKYGSYPTKHLGHTCGSDVTSVMPSDHKNNANTYLTPFKVADLTCASGQTCQSGQCVAAASCGDGSCNGIENCGTCIADCPCTGGRICLNNQCVTPSCGDGSCNGIENCGTCVSDCPCTGGRICLNNQCVTPSCGDGSCNGIENCGFCLADCPCASGKICLNNQCVTPSCGDGSCNGIENCGTCISDCACGSGSTCQNNQCCTPNCVVAGKECGNDGCGGICGTCPIGEACNAQTGQCVCAPSCIEGQVCGDDGCGGQCGSPCPEGTTCDTADNACVTDCIPNCEGDKECGNDGCNGNCGVCAAGTTCNAQTGLCVCAINCAGKVCGDNGCGGQCGDSPCPSGTACNQQTGKCICTPNCEGKECGSDGCGGNCGGTSPCPSGKTCIQNQCVCIPQCTGKQCGSDGCGGQCGDSPCPSGTTCNQQTGQCACAPNCTGKQCGDNGCGAACGFCTTGKICNNQTGLCVCAPNCSGKLCGSDGCTGNCGTCLEGTICNNQTGLCVCAPNCSGKLCGSDGCGGQCGDSPCPSGTTCSQQTGQCAIIDLTCMTLAQVAAERTRCLYIYSTAVYAYGEYPTKHLGHSCGSDVTSVMPQSHKSMVNTYLTPFKAADLCAACTPNCSGKACGNDGCGGSCGTCVAGQTCNAQTGQCACIPNCTNKQCGNNGCGGSCGTCSAGTTCNTISNKCVASCTPSCSGKLCGDNGCGGSCGTCAAGKTCNAQTGQCVCAPNCSGKQCGSDGCGGSCGSCSAGSTCSSDGNCIVDVIPAITNENLPAKAGLNFNDAGRSFSAFFNLDTQEAAAAEEVPTESFWLIGRWTGMLAYALLALSILGGVYRLSLIKRWKRDPVIKFHAIVSYAAMILVVTHLLGLILDRYKWGSSLYWTNSLIPSFASSIDVWLALGVLGTYLMIIGVIGCILFKITIKKAGYKTWLWGHRLTLFSYVFVYVHAWKLGTDFRDTIYLAVFQTLFFFVVGKYVHDLLDRHHQMENIKPFESVQTKVFDHDAAEPIAKIQFERALENQIVSIRGDLIYNRFMHNYFWYYVSDGNTHIWAYSSARLPAGIYGIKGILRFFKDMPYVEIREHQPLPSRNS